MTCAHDIFQCPFRGVGKLKLQHFPLDLGLDFLFVFRLRVLESGSWNILALCCPFPGVGMYTLENVLAG